eukprot:5658623-Prymnesium_polylepis.1
MPSLQQVSTLQIEKILRATEEVTLADREVLYEQGDENCCFCVVQKGLVQGTKVDADGFEEISTFGAGAVLCESALLGSVPASMTFVASGGVQLLRLRRVDIEQELGAPVQTVVEVQTNEAKKWRPGGEFALSSFQHTALLRLGAFSNVHLVLHTPTQQPFALKCMRKGESSSPLSNAVLCKANCRTFLPCCRSAAGIIPNAPRCQREAGAGFMTHLGRPSRGITKVTYRFARSHLRVTFAATACRSCAFATTRLSASCLWRSRRRNRCLLCGFQRVAHFVDAYLVIIH